MWGACCRRHIEIAELLINAGADVNKKRKVLLSLQFSLSLSKENLSDGKVLLWVVCFNGHVKMTKLLINAGADVNQTNEVRSTL